MGGAIISESGGGIIGRHHPGIGGRLPQESALISVSHLKMAADTLQTPS
jgi:hypothetical protein